MAKKNPPIFLTPAALEAVRIICNILRPFLAQPEQLRRMLDVVCNYASHASKDL